MRRNKTDSLQTRANLLHAALDVFDQFGVSRATLAQIAAAAGVTRGALYWHFKNKEELFDAMCEQMLTELEQNLTARGCKGNSWSTIQDDIMTFFAYLLEHEETQKFFRVLYTKWEHTENNLAIRLVWEKYQGLWHQRIYGLLENARTQGELPEHLDLEDTVAALRAVQWGLTGSWSYLRNFDLLKVGKTVLTGVLHSLQEN